MTLLEAAEQGNLTEVRRQIETLGVNIRLCQQGEPHQGVPGYQVIHLAVIGGHTHVVQYLLQRDKTLVHERAKNGNLPLFCLPEEDGPTSIAIARLLIQAGADVNSRAYYSQTLLIEAASRNKPKLAALLLERRALVDTQITIAGPGEGGDVWIGDTALIAAAKKGAHDILLMLMLHGAAPGTRNAKGLCALDIAEDRKDTIALSILKDPEGERKKRESFNFGQHVIGLALFIGMMGYFLSEKVSGDAFDTSSIVGWVMMAAALAVIGQKLTHAGGERGDRILSSVEELLNNIGSGIREHSLLKGPLVHAPVHVPVDVDINARSQIEASGLRCQIL